MSYIVQPNSTGMKTSIRKTKIIIATDSFKGCLNSSEVALAVEEGIRAVLPESDVLRFPVADGGEGILDVLVNASLGKYIPVRSHDPLMQPIEARYGVSGDNKTALIEMAVASGLPLVPVHLRNPLLTTTWGTGELIKDALSRGYRNFILGIGGSATNDAGLGVLQALGFRFLDGENRALGVGGEVMEKVVAIDCSAALPSLKEARFTVACDVDNPFCGTNGAATVFAPQKGADAAMTERLDAGMRSLATVIQSATGKDISRMPGAGAAGGLGGSLAAFLNAALLSGIGLLLDTLCFDQKIAGSDLIITGEGTIDRQTLSGKVPFGILQAAQKQHIPVVAIAGKVEDKEMLMKAGFADVCAINPEGISLEKAMHPDYAKRHIRQTVMRVLKGYPAFL